MDAYSCCGRKQHNCELWCTTLNAILSRPVEWEAVASPTNISPLWLTTWSRPQQCLLLFISKVPDSLPNCFYHLSQTDSLHLMTKFIWRQQSKLLNLRVITLSVNPDMRRNDYGSTVSYPIDPEISSKPIKVSNTRIPLSIGHLHLKHTYQSLLVYTVFTWEAAYSPFHLRSLSKRKHGG